MDNISVEDFDLLMRALERQTQDHPERIKTDQQHFTYTSDGSLGDYIYVSKPSYDNALFVSFGIGGNLRKCEKPSIFQRKRRKMWYGCHRRVHRVLKGYNLESAESKILAALPCAKDIIAEQKLLDDNKD